MYASLIDAISLLLCLTICHSSFLLVLSSSLKFFMQCTQEFFLHFQRQTFCSAALTLTFIQDAFLSKAI